MASRFGKGAALMALGQGITQSGNIFAQGLLERQKQKEEEPFKALQLESMQQNVATGEREATAAKKKEEASIKVGEFLKTLQVDPDIKEAFTKQVSAIGGGAEVGEGQPTLAAPKELSPQEKLTKFEAAGLGPEATQDPRIVKLQEEAKLAEQRGYQEKTQQAGFGQQEKIQQAGFEQQEKIQQAGFTHAEQMAAQKRNFDLGLKGDFTGELEKLRAKLEVKEEFKKEGEVRKRKETQEDIAKGLDLVITLAGQVKAQGRVGGFLAKGASLAGFAAKTKALNDTAGLLAGQVAKKIGGESGRLTDQDRVFALNVMPKVTDTGDERKIKIAVLKAFKDPNLTSQQMKEKLYNVMATLNVPESEETEEPETSRYKITSEGAEKEEWTEEEEKRYKVLLAKQKASGGRE